MTGAEPEPYAIEWARPAKRALGRLPEKVVSPAIELIYGPLSQQPHRVGRPLRFELEGLHSAHRGDYRVIYRIDDVRRVVYVDATDHRADAYGRS